MRYSHFTLCTLAAAVAATASVAQAQDHSAMPAPGAYPTTRAASGAPAMSGEKPMLPPGVVEKAIDDRSDLTDLLGEATNAGLTNGGFDDLIERLNDQDRNRLGKDGTTDDDEKNKVLNGRIDQIRKAFKDKYGSELDLDGNSDELFTDAQFVRGEVQDSSKLMANWPLPADGKKGGMKSGGAAGTVADANVMTPTETTPAEAANLENGRAIAVGVLPARAGAPMVCVSVVGEVTSWKLDVPNRMSVDQLRSSLLAHLTAAGEMTNQWPAGKQEAQAALARHVLRGIYGLPVERSGAAKQ